MDSLFSEASDELTLVLSALRDFAELTTDYASLVQLVARRLAEHLSASCEVYSLSDDARALSFEAAYSLPSAGAPDSGAHAGAGLLPLQEAGATRWVVETGKTWQFPPDAAGAPEHTDSAVMPHSRMLLPLRFDRSMRVESRERADYDKRHTFAAGSTDV